MLALRFVAVALLVTLQLPAQRTWIVDQAGGPGFDFLDLPAALTAARDGDTIIARPGTYRAGATSKELTLLGEPGARIGGPFPVTLNVLLIGLGRTFVVKGFEFDYSGSSVAPMQFSSVNGGACRVHLEDLVVLAPPSNAQTGFAGIFFSGLTVVTMSNCRATGSPGVYADQCGALSVNRCHVAGQDCSSPTVQSSPAMIVQSSNTVLTECVVRGGNGLGGSSPQPASPALLVYGSGVVIAGDSGSSFAAGTLGTQPVSALVDRNAFTTTVDIDPAVQLQPYLGAPAALNFRSVRTVREPAVWAIQTPSQLQTVFFTPAGHNLVLLLSAPDYRYSLPPFGDLWIDPTQIFLAIGTVQDQTEHWQLSFPLDASVPRGLPLGIQGLSGPGLNLQLSTPSVVVLH